MTEIKQTTSDKIVKKLNLTSIYPTAKTSEDRLRDNQNRERMMLGRQPRHLVFSTATRLFVVIVLGMFLFTITPAVVSWNVLSGTFNVVLGALILLAVIVWQTGEIRNAMNKKGVNDTVFFGIYAIVFVTPMLMTCHYINQQSGVVLAALYVAFFLIHYIFVKLLITSLLRQR